MAKRTRYFLDPKGRRGELLRGWIHWDATRRMYDSTCFICGVTGVEGYDWVNGGNRRKP